MAAVTENKLIVGKRFIDSQVSYPVAAERIYGGTLAFIDASTGYLTGDDNGGANAFAGVTKDEVDNSAGSAGDLNCEVYTRGEFELTGSSFAQSTVRDKIYAIDNYTTQAGSSSATLVGVCTQYISATKIMVDIEAGVTA